MGPLQIQVMIRIQQEYSWTKLPNIQSLRMMLTNPNNHPQDEDYESRTQQSNVKLELEALRSSGQNKSIFKLERGKTEYENRSSLRRAQSNIDVIGGSMDR